MIRGSGFGLPYTNGHPNPKETSHGDTNDYSLHCGRASSQKEEAGEGEGKTSREDSPSSARYAPDGGILTGNGTDVDSHVYIRCL